MPTSKRASGAARARPSPRPRATCHPDKPAVAKGLCAACYHRARRRAPRLRAALAQATQAIVTATAAAGAPLPPTLAELIATAERELAETIPEAARALRKAIQVAADAGDARPALQFLSQLPIDAKDGSRRLLEPPARPRGPSTGVQVIIGARLDAEGRVLAAAQILDVERGDRE